MPINPESMPKPDYSSGEWLDTLTYYEIGDQVTCPEKHGGLVLTVTKVREVRPGDRKFALHAQYLELSDQFGIIEDNISAALVKPVKTEGDEEVEAPTLDNEVPIEE